MAKDRVYLDHNATTPLDARVRDAMWPHFREQHGNPSSLHAEGRGAHAALEQARAQVASLLGGAAREVFFTASGTEANNTVIASVAARHDHQGRIVVSSLEHPSIHAAAARAAESGLGVDEVTPGEVGSGEEGVVTAAAVEAALREDTRLVCLMLASNELGTLQPVAEVAALCRRRGVPVLCDAVQAPGKVAVDVAGLGVDYLSIGGHKFYAPPGVAALWVHPGRDAPRPLLVGGSQEGGRRASTENVPSIVGLGAASELAARELDERRVLMENLRRRFEDGLGAIEDVSVHCRHSPRLPNTSHVAFGGVSGHRLMLWLDERGFAVSTGSACHVGEPKASRALVTMGISEEESLSSLRVSFGLDVEEGDVDRFLAALDDGVRLHRRRPPLGT